MVWSLEKPAFNPPSFLFGPVWTALYILMGISLYHVWMEGWERGDVRVAAALFCMQLVMNAGWTFFFFGLESPFLGFVEIIALWCAIVISMVFFFRIRKNAGILLIPYLLWVSFAMALTFTIWTLNP